MKKNTVYTIYEHEAIYLHKGEQRLSQLALKQLQLFYQEKNFPYYTLIHQGVRFCEYVGVIKIGNLTIEVLPKADKTGDERYWRNMLTDMMRSVGLLNPDAPSYANLKIRDLTILDMYLELFVSEVEKLIHKGLVKKYRSRELISTTLKGKLLIGKQITKNHIHQERFYVNQTVYDKEHLLHQILFKCLYVVVKLGSATHLLSRYNSVLIDFPEQANMRVSESLFDNIVYNRKSQDYRAAIDIAKIILLNYHPDLSQGSSHILALMFDMNVLWEKFVLKSLQRFAESYTVSGQVSKKFWTPALGYTKTIRPDIVISKDGKLIAVLDTKWKNIGNSNPSDDDLRQLYAYSRFHQNASSYLVYPGDKSICMNGNYHKAFEGDTETPGGIIKLKVVNGKRDGMEKLSEEVLAVLEEGCIR